MSEWIKIDRTAGKVKSLAATRYEKRLCGFDTNTEIKLGPERAVSEID